MNRLQSQLPVRASYLSAQDVSQLFRLLDKDNSGRLGGAEVTNMFSAICGCQVTVSGARTSYTLSQFGRVIEDMNRSYPYMKVVQNLMKYLRENATPLEEDPFCIENCQKVMEIMDTDKTGVLDIQELWKMFQFLKIRINVLIEAYSSYQEITSAEELQSLLKEMDSKYPHLDIDNKVVKFLGKAAAQGGKPDISSVVPQPAAPPPAAEPQKKKALLVGINYLGQQSELGGCINDVRNQMKVLTEKFGFAEDDVLLLTEDQGRDDRMPTKANIMQGFSWLLEGVSAGDLVFFQYSGHGSQMPDRTGSEPDGKNECICPVDCMKGWPEYIILDNEIYNTFYVNLPEGVMCTCIFDCCHSGTISDLQCTRDFVFSEDEKPRYLDPPEDIAAELEQVVGSRAVADPSQQVPSKKLWTFSGCQDNQTSADATINGQRQGALTWAFLKSLEDNGWRSPYEELLTGARKNLKGKYEQVPALSTTCDAFFKEWYLEMQP